MSSIEIIAALFGGLLSAAGAYLAYRRGSKADAKALEKHTDVYAGYVELLRKLQEDNDDLRKKLEGTADAEYVDSLEKRLDRAWARLDVSDKRLEQAEVLLDQCKRNLVEQKQSMGEQIRALEARLEGST